MRRLVAPLLVLAALVAAVPAAAELRPVDRRAGEIELPRIRPGHVVVPKGHERGRITVVVRLAQPPLAQWSGRSLQARGGSRRLDVAGVSSRAYLARLARAQEAAAAQLRRAIPEANVYRRFRVVLNALAVELPAASLPTLVRQGFATRVYPSVRYRLALDRSPQLMDADALWAAGGGGTRGDGIKIGVVDDGIDQANAFFAAAGYEYPEGFPKGGTKWTTPKVIVARTFPGPGSGAGGRLAVDPRASFHGTHVAGIAAGNAGTTAPAGSDHPRTEGLSGVAPRAWLGNYRVFTVPTPIGNVANTPEIVAAFESAVTDGMDVINFSGGGAEAEPVNDAMIETVANVVAAGVVPVISAGNDRDDFGTGTAGSPGTAPEAISVAAVSNSQVFASSLELVDPVALAAADPVPAHAGGADSRSVGERRAVPRRRGARRPVPLRPGGEPEPGRAAPVRVAQRCRRRRVARHLHLHVEGRACAPRRRDRAGVHRQPPRRGQHGSHAARAAERDDLGRRRRGPQGVRHRERRRDARPPPFRDAVAPDRPQRDRHELLVGGPDRVRAPAQAGRGRTRAGRSCRRRCRSPEARSPSSTGRAWRRRTSPVPRHSCASATRVGRRAR